MNTQLWKIKKEKLEKTNIFLYANFVEKKFKIDVKKNFNNLWRWSVNNPQLFWKSIWDFTKIRGDLGSIFLQKSEVFYKNKFFPDSKLNYAENLLKRNDATPAIIFKSENGYKSNTSWKNLNLSVGKVSQWLSSKGIGKGDRVAAYLPNIPETVIAYLSTSALGAIWSSCSPDFGTLGVIDRISQIKPKVLFIGDKYFYNGKTISIIDRLKKIVTKIPSITKVVIVPYPGTENKKKENLKIDIYHWEEILNSIQENKTQYERIDFNSPLAILYSSGTTGKPKCICHGAGGVLLQHNKELQIHCDVKKNDKIFYFTTCGWMMWNWLVSSLAAEATILLFDGFPLFGKDDLLFEYASEEQITLLGISAKYIDTLNNNKINPGKNYDLSKLRTICSTGSPLSIDGFEYVYKNIKKDVHLASISGGTDIVSCFVLGNLFQPVYRGEIQNKGLGMDVDIFNDKGVSLKNTKGELVCKTPFPSMPVKFWEDDKNKKYKSAYFEKYKNVWHHGDFAKITNNGGFVIYGRSDTTLNPGGVRLGTAEIYSVVEKFEEIKESIVIGQSWKNDIRIILFVVLNSGYELNQKIKDKIKREIRSNASPRHVPSKIVAILDIPKTKNGKLVELAVKQTVEGEAIKNLEALANPDSLKQFKNIKELNE